MKGYGNKMSISLYSGKKQKKIEESATDHSLSMSDFLSKLITAAERTRIGSALRRRSPAFKITI